MSTAIAIDLVKKIRGLMEKASVSNDKRKMDKMSRRRELPRDYR
jgi:hypothetical protein